MTKEQKLKNKVIFFKEALAKLTERLECQIDEYRQLDEKYDIMRESFDKLVELKRDGEEIARDMDSSHFRLIEHEVLYLRSLLRETVLPTDKLKLTIPPKESYDGCGAPMYPPREIDRRRP